MAYTPTRLAAATLTNALATYYTVPAGKSVIVKQILFANTGGTAATANLRFAGTYILFGVSVPANSTLMFDLTEVLNATELIEAYSSSTNAMTIMASGVVFP